MSDATGSGYTAHAQIHVRLNKSGAHIAVVRFLNHVVIIMGVAMDTEPYPVVAGLLIRKAVTW